MGFAVLDVVEGSAIEALLHMKTYLASRPSSFASVDQAINWHIRSRTIRDLESAKASVPSLLIPKDDRWVWRTDLARTQRWWEEWFTGMSGLFLRGRAAKALVLAGTDRLDKELMVGQMQGRSLDYSSGTYRNYRLTNSPQANSNSQSYLKQATLSKKTCRRRQHT